MQNYNLPTVNFDNTFEGVVFTLPTDAKYDLTLAVVKLQVRVASGTVLVKEFSSPAALLITLPHTITFPPTSIEIPAGEYKWDLKIWFADGREKTYIGGTWKINSVITR
jgi:hypothetical protein